MLLKSDPPFGLWSISRYLSFAQKLFFLILCAVGIYTLYSAVVVTTRLRTMKRLDQKEDLAFTQWSTAALRKRCMNAQQLIRATFYLFGVMVFLGLQGAYLILDEGRTTG